MIRATAEFLRFLPRRLGVIQNLVRDPVLSRSYYPDEPRKSKFRILLDNLWWLLRYQEANDFYYCYGLDRKNGPGVGTFLNRWNFKKMRDRAQEAYRPKRFSLTYDHRCLVDDKFLFGQYITSLGYPTPRILALTHNDSISWIQGEQKCSLDTFLEQDLDVFLKEILGGCGVGVFHAIVRDGNLRIDGEDCALSKLKTMLSGQTFILQDRVEQHEAMSKIYPHSVNTVRLVTVMKDQRPELFGAFIRAGANGLRRDNWAVGGILGGVDSQTGEVSARWKFKPGFATSSMSHPNTGFVFAGFRVPYYEAAVRMAIELHGFLYGVHSIGWDVAISPDGPVFLEGNSQWSIEGYQTPHGGLKAKCREMLSPQNERK